MIPNSNPMRYAAFTLVEVLVVLIILGIAATVVIPMISDTSQMQVTSAARQIASTVLYAQTASISNQQQFQVVFDPAGNRYEVQDAAGNVIDDPVVGSPYRVEFSQDRRTRNVTLDTVDFDGTQTLWFDRMGSPYAGSISQSPPPLASGQIVVRVKDKTLTILVEPVTGRIRLQ
ncbi:MAG: prepilin-type N-terminal cleavage/methylation domain-containing protein [Sedimentisphaerales bacterium]|nr:prepilin-type N-terminal cleavage/methylation domain-containing protein [Sedimentisphaerales bacterium]